MAIYEFYCPACHTLYSFLARRMGVDRRPSCPRCSRPDLERQVSLFAISKGRKEGEAGGDDAGSVDEERLMRAFESMAGELSGVDEDDPRAAARMMRKLYEAAGLPLGAGMDEAMQRLEAGQDPDAIEQELGDALTEEGEALEAGSPRRQLASLMRKLPPRTDPKLYEL